MREPQPRVFAVRSAHWRRSIRSGSSSGGDASAQPGSRRKRARPASPSRDTRRLSGTWVIGREERRECLGRMLAGRRHPDLLEIARGFGLQMFRQLVQHGSRLEDGKGDSNCLVPITLDFDGSGFICGLRLTGWTGWTWRRATIYLEWRSNSCSSLWPFCHFSHSSVYVTEA
jgi:hypothetical protein